MTFPKSRISSSANESVRASLFKGCKSVKTMQQYALLKKSIKKIYIQNNSKVSKMYLKACDRMNTFAKICKSMLMFCRTY